MSALRLSVVVPVRDMADTIGPCLEALLAQSYPRAQTEILVVDNGSTDDTVSVIRRYPVRCLMELTPGAAAARNRGLAEATGDFVAFTDADCVPTRGWLARIAHAATRDAADVVAGGLTVLDPSASTLAAYSAGIGQYDPEASARHPVYPYAVTANVAIRRERARRVGGFDAAFSTFDSADLFWRMSREAPLEITVEPRALVFYRTRASLRALAVQNFRYGLGYARFCCRIPEARDAVRPATTLRRWRQRLAHGISQLTQGPDEAWHLAARLCAVHVVRETSMVAGTVVGYRRFVASDAP